MTKKKKPIITGLALVLALLMVLGMSSSAGLIALAEGPEDDLVLEELELIEEAPEALEVNAINEEEPEPVGNDGNGEEAVGEEAAEAAENDQKDTGASEDEGSVDNNEPVDEKGEPAAEEKLAVEETEEASGEEEASLASQFTADAFSNGSEPSYTEWWDGRGTDSEKCEYAGQPGRPETGWIHWVFSTKGDSTDAELVLGGTGSGTYAPGEPLNAEVWHFYTPYFELDGLTATINLYGGAPGPGGGLVISDYCPGEFERLEVSKTAVTSYSREHYWNIDKKVETENEEFINGTPKVWLYVDGSGDETATWTVDVTYQGYEDSDWNVSGEIIIENTGQLDAVITGVEDWLGGMPINVYFPVSFPYTLPVGATLTGTYSEDGFVDGFNEVTVTTERDQYFADAEIIWGEPTTEINETVNIKDISELFGELELGTVTAPNDAQFTYSKDFAYEDYDECGSYQYDNTASIVETGQFASATLKVNVQCLVYETAYAKGEDAICFIPTFGNWGWTNPIMPGEYTWDLWAGAAQCDTSRGALVGSVTVVYDEDGYVTAEYNLLPGYELKETHVYAGSTMFPQRIQGRGNRYVSTVAPGQYYNAGPFDGEQVYVIAHAVVGMPDSNFGF